MKNLERLTNQELVSMQEYIAADPTNRSGGGLCLYNRNAHRKLDAIARQITQNLREAKLARGEHINDEGYSGRQTNRR